ncbi:1,4-alpha-glucan branching enzyme [Tumebacillus sp. BK434]|uniref:1,4-alpha-glucan branching protein domain-containing protein n=1 Tax=Tumebacillus sp. BK434 TaxID=2512169 RepID=UPI0010DFCBF2|nr:1,4-alpha-glucan branching protein domain-containing protein [Tumebacillus sp. BK434]TCP53727.1 1,4-alpha-glucan branching enzyme [Tumebacillus sp. BK434]
MKKGYLAMILHAHLPYVRHAEGAHALEERWLFEALSETYLPLLAVFERLRETCVPFAYALTVSPTLLTLLTDEAMGARYVKHMKKTIELTEKELVRTVHESELQNLARMYYARYRGLLDQFEGCGRDVTARLADLEASGHLELMTCGATHGFLPVIGREELRRAQVALACETHERIIGRRPRGIWLPECGYLPGIERVLADEGLAYFLVDSHAFGENSVYRPLMTAEADVYALGRDPESAGQVWSSFSGYPGHPNYREYYRDIGFDLELSYIRDHIHPEGIRVNTGIKYHRVTGRGNEKELYNPVRAAATCSEHAEHFVTSRLQRLHSLDWTISDGRPPLITAPYDAELFGHWWYEGPQWLEQVALKLAGTELGMTTPGAYLQQFPEATRAELVLSSWGRGGYADVWLNETNDWIYPHLHRLEERLVDLVRRAQRSGSIADPLTGRALRQLARETLLAEASDWPFMITMGTTVDYGVRRTTEHLARAERLAAQIEANGIREDLLAEWEAATPIFPELHLGHFLEEEPAELTQSPERRVLMLSWEFPPRTIGGLARHVYDLSRAMAEAGIEVHVVTCHGEGTPEYEVVDGVHVHRVQAPDYEHDDFVQWAALLNIRLGAMGSRVLAACGPFDLIHAHDWLAAECALLLSEMSGLPLVTTIHATEHGRNHGVHNDLQHRIFAIEQQLARESAEVIVCSKYMQQELGEIYGIARDRLHVLPNGVDLTELSRGLRSSGQVKNSTAKTVFYVGRLVPEKGVQVLLASAPALLQHHPDTRFVIAGKGPMLAQLKEQAAFLGIAEQVDFLGFVSDEERNRLMLAADAAVFPSLYEPFGIVALEAMGAGTPTVAARTGGLAEILDHGRDGWLVEPGDPGNLCDTLLQLFADPDGTRATAERGRQKAIDAYSWPAIARGTLLVYEQALQKKVQEAGEQR